MPGRPPSTIPSVPPTPKPRKYYPRRKGRRLERRVADLERRGFGGGTRNANVLIGGDARRMGMRGGGAHPLNVDALRRLGFDEAEIQEMARRAVDEGRGILVSAQKEKEEGGEGEVPAAVGARRTEKFAAGAKDIMSIVNPNTFLGILWIVVIVLVIWIVLQLFKYAKI